MSRHHVSHTQPRVLNDIRTLPLEKLIDLYGIEVSDDGTVFDPTENRKFASLADWADCVAEQEDESNYSTFSKIGGRYAFDDED